MHTPKNPTTEVAVPHRAEVIRIATAFGVDPAIFTNWEGELLAVYQQVRNRGDIDAGRRRGWTFDIGGKTVGVPEHQAHSIIANFEDEGIPFERRSLRWEYQKRDLAKRRAAYLAAP